MTQQGWERKKCSPRQFECLSFRSLGCFARFVAVLFHEPLHPLIRVVAQVFLRHLSDLRPQFGRGIAALLLPELDQVKQLPRVLVWAT